MSLSPALPRSTASTDLVPRVVLTDRRTRARVDDAELRTADAPEMTARLPMWLYGVLHAGRSQFETELPFHSRDHAVEEEFRRSTAHQLLTREYPVVHRDEDHLVVVREGVRVIVPRSLAHADSGRATLRLAVPSYRRRLSPGFFLAHGSRPADHSRPVLRVYAHLELPGSATLAWAAATRFLEGAGVRYQAKVLSTPSMYPRRDALVVYLDGRDRDSAHPLAEELRPFAAPGISAFARELAPGVAMAWEPSDRRTPMLGMSFGQHRAHVLAQAVLADAADREGLFLAAGIDPSDLSRNVDSPP